jgi:oxygen-dependent protoporphyrinogen oxidase
MNHDPIIVGGGMAGLSCAWRLTAAGLRPLVLEAAPEAGGNVRSETVEGFRLERGPHTFLSSADQIFGLASEVGLEDQLVQSRPGSSARFIVRDTRLHQAPDGLGTFLSTHLLSWRSKLRLVAEPLFTGRGRSDDSALRFFERRFGPEAARVIAGAFVSGVYAGDPAALSAPAAFPLFWGFEQDRGSMVRGAIRHQRQKKVARLALGDAAPPRRSGLWSFRLGLGQLSAALAGKLGPRFRAGSPVAQLALGRSGFRLAGTGGNVEARQLVLAVPPHEAARLLAGVDPELSDLLAGIPMAPVAVISLGFQERLDSLPDGFGFLAPRGEGVCSLGVLFPSRVFAGRAPLGGDLLTAYMGGMLDSGALDLDDETLAGLVLDDITRLTGRRAEPCMVRVTRHRTAIPQLVIGHLERMARVKTCLDRLPGLHLAGNYLRGVGIKDAVASGLETAETVLRRPGAGCRIEEAVA